MYKKILYVTTIGMILTISATGCSEGEVIGTGANITGTAAVGDPINNSLVEIKVANGEKRDTTTDGQGKYEIAAIDNNQTHLVRVSRSNDDNLYSITAGAGVTNIHPFTDWIIRNWFSTNGLEIDTEFNSTGAITLLPDSDEIDAIKNTVKQLIAVALEEYGISSELDLISTQFNANGSGFDRFLDNADVIINNQKVTVTISSADNNNFNVVVNNIDLSQDLSTDDISPPTPPGNVSSITADQSQILMTWNAASDDTGVSGYNIYRDGVYIDTVFFNSYSDAGLTTSTTYCYEVEAIDGAGNVSERTIIDPCPGTRETTTVNNTTGSTSGASALQFLYAAPMGNSIEINWQIDETVNLSQLASYDLYRSENGAVKTLLENLLAVDFPSNQLKNYMDISLDLSINYCYEIVALDARDNEIGRSIESCITLNQFTPRSPVPDPGLSAVSFATDRYFTKEGEVSAEIVVNRYGDISQALEVFYGTESASAVAGEDFIDATGGSLTWAANDGSPKSFFVQIRSDAIDDPEETLFLNLGSLDALTDLSSATLTILQ